MNKVFTGIDRSGSFRVYLTISTDLVEEARQIHQTTPLGTAALGRVLTGAGLMGLLLKNEKDKLTVIFKGDGPAKQILATANSFGEVKGYIANPDVDLPLRPDGKLDVGGSLGIGELTVIKDLGLKEPFIGTIALASGEIAEDLTAYYYISEQQNSAISLGVKIETNVVIGRSVKIDELMEKEGVICGYHTLIDWEKTSAEKVNALIEVRVTPQRGNGFDSIAEKIYKYSEVHAVYLISGGYDLLVTLEGKSLKEISSFVSEKLSTLDSVLSTATHFILKRYKYDSVVLSESSDDERCMQF